MICLIPILLLGNLISHVLTSSLYSKLELQLNNKYNLEESEEIFEQFIKKFEKKYATRHEHEHHFNVFKNNLRTFNERNENADVPFKINIFSDLTEEEFFERHGGCTMMNNTRPEDIIEYVPTGMAPDSLDWRSRGIVTEVKNQMTCGSCFAFSAVGCIESQYAKQSGQLISLSAQQALDCSQGDCRGGFPVDAMQSLAQQGGSMREQDYPYANSKGQCRTDANKIAVRVTGGQQLSVSDGESLKDALANHGPLSVGVKMWSDIRQYPGGIANPTNCLNDGHALLLVGYGTENGVPYWIMKNTWGPSWGEGGYLRLIMGKSACQFGNNVFLAYVA